MIFHSIQEYLLARYEWEQIPIKILPNGKVFSYVNGNWIEGADFDKPHYERMSLNNPDKKNIEHGCFPAKTR